MSDLFSRRDALRLSFGGLVAGTLAEGPCAAADDAKPAAPAPGGAAPARPFLTEAKDFTNVSRGDPQPYTLKGDALSKARLAEHHHYIEGKQFRDVQIGVGSFGTSSPARSTSCSFCRKRGSCVMSRHDRTPIRSTRNGGHTSRTDAERDCAANIETSSV